MLDSVHNRKQKLVQRPDSQIGWLPAYPLLYHGPCMSWPRCPPWLALAFESNRMMTCIHEDCRTLLTRALCPRSDSASGTSSNAHTNDTRFTSEPRLVSPGPDKLHYTALSKHSKRSLNTTRLCLRVRRGAKQYGCYGSTGTRSDGTWRLREVLREVVASPSGSSNKPGGEAGSFRAGKPWWLGIGN